MSIQVHENSRGGVLVVYMSLRKCARGLAARESATGAVVD
jgi:hypothetical protein